MCTYNADQNVPRSFSFLRLPSLVPVCICVRCCSGHTRPLSRVLVSSSSSRGRAGGRVVSAAGSGWPAK